MYRAISPLDKSSACVVQPAPTLLISYHCLRILSCSLVSPQTYMAMAPAPKNADPLSSSRAISTEPSRKRRRQAVMCSECRRRKIACDRNVPCTQCIQSKSNCLFYNSYNSYADWDQARSVPDISQPVYTPSICQTAHATQTGSQLSLVPLTDNQSQFTYTTKPSAIPAASDLFMGINGTATVDVLPFLMTIYPGPEDGYFLSSLFGDLSGDNGTTNMTEFAPMAI
jgi:hypothetical protein